VKRYLPLLLFLMFLAAFLARSYNLNAPPFEQRRERQSQTMSTIMDYYRHGIDLMMPKANCVGYPYYLVLEFPAFQAIGAVIFKAFGPRIEYLRLFNILQSLFGALLLYLLAKRWYGARAAVYAAFFFLFFPLNIVYQRAALIDPMIVTLLIASIYLLSLFYESERHLWPVYILLFPVFALGITMKVLYFLPFFMFALLYLFQKGKPVQRSALVFMLLAGFALLAAWAHHAAMVSGSLTDFIGFSELLTSRFYFTIFWRTINIMFTPVGILFYLLSLIWLFAPPDRSKSWDMRMRDIIVFSYPVIYLLLFAHIIKPHSYYHLPMMPFLAISCGLGLTFLERNLRSGLSERTRNTIVAACLLALALSSFQVMIASRYFMQNKDVTLFAERIKGRIPADRNVIFIGGPSIPEVLDVDLGMGGGPKDRKYLCGKYCDASYLYAMDAYGLTVEFDDYRKAGEYLKEKIPTFKGHLDYVVFYDMLDFGARGRAGLSPLFDSGFGIVYRDENLLIFGRSGAKSVEAPAGIR